MIKRAYISHDKKYRYHLSRIWDASKPMVMFIGHNPSMAGKGEEDPEVKRMIKFSQQWGYGGFYLVNLLAYRTEDKQELMDKVDPMGSMNSSYIRQIIGQENIKLIVCCWGDLVDLDLVTHSKQVIKRILSVKKEIKVRALKINQSGEPASILSLPYNSKLKPYEI